MLHATVEPPTIRIERWGNQFFTIHNSAQRQEQVTLTIDRRALQLQASIAACEQIAAITVKSASSENAIVLTFPLPAGGYGMISLQRAK